MFYFIRLMDVSCYKHNCVFQCCSLCLSNLLPWLLYAMFMIHSTSHTHQMRLAFEWHCPTKPTFTRVEIHQYQNKGMGIRSLNKEGCRLYEWLLCSNVICCLARGVWFPSVSIYFKFLFSLSFAPHGFGHRVILQAECNDSPVQKISRFGRCIQPLIKPTCLTVTK